MLSPPTSSLLVISGMHAKWLTFLRDISPLRIRELILAQPDPLLHAWRDGLTSIWIEWRVSTQPRKKKMFSYLTQCTADHWWIDSVSQNTKKLWKNSIYNVLYGKVLVISFPQLMLHCPSRCLWTVTTTTCLLLSAGTRPGWGCFH